MVICFPGVLQTMMAEGIAFILAYAKGVGGVATVEAGKDQEWSNLQEG